MARMLASSDKSWGYCCSRHKSMNTKRRCRSRARAREKQLWHRQFKTEFN